MSVIEEVIALFDHRDRKIIGEMIILIKETMHILGKRKPFPVFIVHDIIQYAFITAFQLRQDISITKPADRIRFMQKRSAVVHQIDAKLLG